MRIPAYLHICEFSTLFLPEKLFTYEINIPCFVTEIRLFNESIDVAPEVLAVAKSSEEGLSALARLSREEVYIVEYSEETLDKYPELVEYNKKYSPKANIKLVA